MDHVLVLSMDHPELAEAEISSLVDAKVERLDHVLVMEGGSRSSINDLSKRLAYTRRIYRLLFHCAPDEVAVKTKAFDWNKIYKKDFAVRIHLYGKEAHEHLTEARLAGYIWSKIECPAVDLDHPSTPIQFLLMDRLVLACLLLHELDQGFMSRRAHLRPSLHPSSLNPKLARAMVNLTGCKRGDTVLDPFCGTGGILLEAALVGCKTVGSDVDDIMIRRCKENLAHFHIKSPRISKADATKTGLKASYIVADLPYGKNTKQKNTTSLYGAFLRNLSRSKVKCAVLGFPDGTSISRLIAGSKLKIAHQFVIYVHKSMSKRIVVLKKSI